MRTKLQPISAFSLIELVIVVVIISILSLTAVNVFSRTTCNVKDSQLTQNLTLVRNALDHYQAEHNGAYPAIVPDGLVNYSNIDGILSGTKSRSYSLGPYLASMPSIPIGTTRGASGVFFDLSLTRLDGNIPTRFANDPVLAAAPFGCGCFNCSCNTCLCNGICACVSCSARTTPKVAVPSTALNAAWRYNPNNGAIRANSGTTADGSGKLYSSY